MAIFYTISDSILLPNQELVLENHTEKQPLYSIPGWFTEEEVLNFYKNQFPDGTSTHGGNYLLKRIPWYNYSDLEQFILISPMLEVIYELVRKIYFPERMSRLTSLYAWQSLEDAVNFKLTHDRSSSFIYRVEATKYFTADMNLLRMGPTMVGIILMAQKYWAGESSSEPVWEVLLDHPVKVIEKVIQ